MRHQIATLLAALLLLLPAAPAFAKPPKPQRFTYQHEAGSAHVAVLSVIPWQAYVKQLQPNFDLDEDDALAAVEKVSRSMESTFTDSLAFSLRLSGQEIPDSGSSDKADSGDGEDGEDSTSEAGGTGTASGIPTREEIQAIADKIALDKGTGTPFSPTPTTPSLDPMLKYQAATALFQEVKLLNQYVEQAVQRTEYMPFVVRMQVTVLPTARREPYDTYATISFFAGGSESAVPVPARLFDALIQASPPNSQEKSTFEQFKSRMPAGDDTTLRIQSSTTTTGNKALQNPIVVPLLVTDSIEATLHNQVTEKIRQFAFSLLFLIKGWGSQSDFQKFSRDLERVFGRDFNSLMTVGRVTDNTYRVRLGAMQQVAVDYATIPRNHYVTFLLLAPCGLLVDDKNPKADITGKVQVVSQIEWVDAESGKQLSPRSRRKIASELRRAVKSYERYAGVTFSKDFAKEVVNLWKHVHGNDFDTFRNDVKTLIGNPTNDSFPYEAFWLTMADIMSESRFSSTLFELPKEKIPTLPTATTTTTTTTTTTATTATTPPLLGLDDGTSTNVRVVGGEHLENATFTATLNVTKTCGSGCPTYPFPLDKATILNDGRDAVFSFPSLAAWGLGPNDLKLTLDMTVEPRVSNGARCSTRMKTSSAKRSDAAEVSYLLKPKKSTQDKPSDADQDKAGFKLKSISDRVVADPASGEGMADVSITFSTKTEKDKKGKDVKIPLCKKAALEIVQPAVRGAITVTPATARPDAAKLELVANAKLAIPLRNLSCGSPVKIKGKCLDGDKKGGETSLDIEVALYGSGNPCAAPATSGTAATGGGSTPAPGAATPPTNKGTN